MVQIFISFSNKFDISLMHSSRASVFLLSLPLSLPSQHKAVSINQPRHQLQHRPHTNLLQLHTGNQRLALQSTTTTGKSMMPPPTTTTAKMRTEMVTRPQAPTMSPFLMVVSRKWLTLLMDLEDTMLTSLMKAQLSSQLNSHNHTEQRLQLHLLHTGRASKPSSALQSLNFCDNYVLLTVTLSISVDHKYLFVDR